MQTNMSEVDFNTEEKEYILHRRFDRFARLVGDSVVERLNQTHVMIIGLGGVGSWAAESLARSGIGKLTLIDFDEICITNANRQIHTVQGLVGKKKAIVMAERIQKINPQIHVEAMTEFFDDKNHDRILNLKPDFILDAIDNLTAKCFLLDQAVSRNISVITSAGSGGRLDPAKIQIVDLGQTHTDPMAHQVRKILRSRYEQFKDKEFFNIPCVFSTEVPTPPLQLKYDKGEGFKCVCPQGQNGLHSCDSRNLIWGNASFVTGSYGFQMASWVVRSVSKGIV